MAGCVDCLGRTPYGSLIATITLCLGVGLFCGTGYRALDLTLNGIFVRLYGVYIPWMKTILIVFMIFAIVMGVFAMLLLFFGFLSTGLTREKFYSSFKCAISGRVSAICFMVVTYILNTAWLAITFMCAMPIIAYIMVRSICKHEIEMRDFWYLENYCVNLTRFGIYINTTEGYLIEGLCDVIDLSQACEYVYDAGPMFCFAFSGACFIVLGLMMYLVALSSNYERIKSSKELTEYRSVVDLADANNY